jgi:hypothetical protein
VAEGWFHPVRPVAPLEQPSVIAVPMFVESVLTFIFRRHSWRMPSHGYWVVTERKVYVFEFRFGGQTRLRRQVGAFDRDSVTAEAGPEPNSMVVSVPSAERPYEMQGDRFTRGEAEVIRMLVGT